MQAIVPRLQELEIVMNKSARTFKAKYGLHSIVDLYMISEDESIGIV
jgi:hypothetical protein